MGQMVFVLTTKLEGKQGYGPVAVTTDEHTANEWIRAGNDNDWVPLEMNDLSGTGLAGKSVTPFKPVPKKHREQQTQETVERTRQNLRQTNKMLEEALKKKKLFSSRARVAGRRDELKARSQEAEVRLLLRAGQVQDLRAYVLFRPTGSDRAVVEILGQQFTIDFVRRLVNAGVRVDPSKRQVSWPGVKTQADVNRLYAGFPRLTAEDFAWHPKRAGRRDEIKKHYEERAQSILNDYLMDRGEQDPEIYDFLDHLKTEYRADVPEDEYEILVDVLYAAYKKMFGDK